MFACFEIFPFFVPCLSSQKKRKAATTPEVLESLVAYSNDSRKKDIEARQTKRVGRYMHMHGSYHFTSRRAVCFCTTTQRTCEVENTSLSVYHEESLNEELSYTGLLSTQNTDREIILNAAARLLLSLVSLWGHNALLYLVNKHNLCINIDKLPNNSDDNKGDCGAPCLGGLFAPVETLNGAGRARYPETYDEKFPQQSNENGSLAELHCPADDYHSEQKVE